tara:strand:+ start:1993 stop:3024 length:1032 start_codon:yes stop_codon:yes gene_type:complete
MITLIYGRPGTGKTYEAVKYHILPNLKLGNKVFTNIPINVSSEYLTVNETPEIFDIVRLIDSSDVELTFVLDEFQFLLKEDEDAWFQLLAQHRKFRTDFFIITQSPLSLSEKMQDLISFSHKITHNPFFLKKWSYIKKVYDGVPTLERVVVLSSKLRFYSRKTFSNYNSFYQRDYVKTGNLFHFDNKSNIMFWPVLAAITLVFLIYNFSTERDFSLKSYISHSKAHVNLEEKKDIPVTSERELKTETPQNISNENEQEVGIEESYSDMSLINLLFNSKIIIDSWYVDRGEKVTYFEVEQNKTSFKLTSNNMIFKKIEIINYEDCLLVFQYKNQVKVITCPPNE